MRILMMGINDPAGTTVLFKRALEAHTEHACRVVTLETRYTHAWDKDLHVPDLDPAGLEELEGLLRASDVFHFHMTADENLQLGPFLPRDFLAGKAVVHHHHGHPDYRTDSSRYLEKYRRLGRRNILVSTPDLLARFPMARWQPNLVAVHEPRYTPAQRSDADWAGPLRLTHSPTRRDLKNTDELLAITARLDGQVVLDLIDDVPHAECLRRKKSAHACFDHMQGYYGMSSLEALSLGLATVAGLNEQVMEHIRDFAGTADLPWLMARSEEELERTLRGLAADPARRRAAGEAGRRFMLESWSDAKVARRLSDFYANLA